MVIIIIIILIQYFYRLHEAEGEIEGLKTVEPMLRKEIENSLEVSCFCRSDICILCILFD